MYTYEGDAHIFVLSSQRKLTSWHFLVCDVSAYHFMSACQAALYRDVTDYSLILLQVHVKDGHKRRASRNRHGKKKTKTFMMNCISSQITPYLYRYIDKGQQSLVLALQ